MSASHTHLQPFDLTIIVLYLIGITLFGLRFRAKKGTLLLYNFLVRRNKVIVEKLRSFAGDLQTYLISKK